MCTDLWKLVQLLRTERSPPPSAAANTDSWQSQTPRSLSHHNLGGTQKRTEKGREKREVFSTLIPVMYGLMNNSQVQFRFAFCLVHTKKKCKVICNVLPRALNICMPPYFPSKSTVLLRGLNALHIRTKTTSKQPGTTTETDCDEFEADLRGQNLFSSLS